MQPLALNRRDLLRAGLGAGAAAAFGPGFWRTALAAGPATPGPGPYGPLGPEDDNGIRLPEGFRSRLIARAGVQVENTDYVWHVFPDGMATYPTEDGGHVLVSNSEASDAVPGQGGASAIRFAADGTIVEAYSILSGTTNNCAGGRTPWGTWLSCEETDRGQVYECDPFGREEAVVRPALGAFDHEAVCVDPDGEVLYLSEDAAHGGFYRFTPRDYPDLSEGLLEIAQRHDDGAVTWHEVPDPAARETQTRDQVPASTPFRRGEGIWFDSGIVYLATTADNTVWAYNTGTVEMERLYHGEALGDRAPIHKVDNVTVAKSGDLFVCEDPGDMGMGIITPEREVARFLSITGNGQRLPAGFPEDVDSEVTGVIFDPSGTRMYFSGQRSFVTGAVYEITGPFRQRRVDAAPPPVRPDVPAVLDLDEAERRGPRIGVRVGEPCELTVVLRAKLPRGQDGRRRTTHLARRTLERGLGPVVFRLHPRDDLRRYTRGRRSIEAELKFAAVDERGLRTTITRDVTLKRS